MTSVYDIIDKIKTYLYDHPSVNHVTFGDIKEVNLAKTTMFPLTHFNISEGTIGSNFISFNLSFLFMDIVDYTKDYDADKDMRDDASNIVDVFNTQLQVANALISNLRRGDLYSDKFQLEGDPTCRMFKDQYENQLAGWRVDMVILIPNNLSVC